MSGYRRQAGGFYVPSVTSPASGYGSTLGRYDLTNVPTHYTGGATRLVSSSGVPRRYQLYSRSDTPSGLTNYDVIRRAADPLAARYRQNRHSWAAGGGGGGLSRSSTVASVGDLQWRRGQRFSSERAGGLLAPGGPDSPTAAERGDSAGSEGDVRGADSAAEAAGETHVVSQPGQTEPESLVLRLDSAPDSAAFVDSAPDSAAFVDSASDSAASVDSAPDSAASVDSAGPGEAIEPSDQAASQAPVAPPRRADPAMRADKGKAVSADGRSQSASDPRRPGGSDRENDRPHQTLTGESSDRPNVLKDPQLNELATASTKITEKIVQPSKSSDTHQIPAVQQAKQAIEDAPLAEPAKVNTCLNDGDQQRSKASTSVQQMKVPKQGQVISSAPDSNENSALLKKEVDSALKNKILPIDKPVNNSSPPNLEHVALQKQQGTIPGRKTTQPVQVQLGESCSSSQNCVKLASDATYQESQQLADVPVRPPRHIPASVGSKAAAVTATNSAANSENTSNNSHIATSMLAKPADEQPCDGVIEVPEPVNGSPKSTSELADCPVLVKSSAMEISDSSSSSGESDDSSTYTYSSSPETSADSELSDQQQNMFGKLENTPIKIGQEEAEGFEAVQTQVKEASVSCSTASEPKEETQSGHIVSQPIPGISETDTEPVDFCLGEETSDLAASTEITKSLVNNCETAESPVSSTPLTSSSSGTADSQSGEFSCSESVSIDSSKTSLVDREEPEQAIVSTVSQNSHLVTSEPGYQQPVTTETEDMTSTHLTPSKVDHPSGAIKNQTDSSVSDSTESDGHGITESSATSESSATTESSTSTTPESTELSRVTRTSSASSFVSSTGSQLTDASESEQTSSVSEESSGSSEVSSRASSSLEPAPSSLKPAPPSSFEPAPSSLEPAPPSSLEPAPVPMDSTSAAATAASPHCPSELIPSAVEAVSLSPGSNSAHSENEHMKFETDSLTSVTPLSTVPPTPMGTEPPTPMDTEPSTPVGTEASMFTDTEGPAFVTDSVTVGSTSQSCEPKLPIFESLSPALDVHLSSPESESSSVCSQSSTSESETYSSESDLTDSSETQPTTESEPDLWPVHAGLHSERKVPTEAQHPSPSVGTAASLSETAACPAASLSETAACPAASLSETAACPAASLSETAACPAASLSETAACPAADQSAVAMSAAPRDTSPEPATTAPDPPALQAVPEAAALEIPPPVTAVTVTDSPKPKHKPVVQRPSKVPQPPAQIQRRPSLTALVIDPVWPDRAEVVSPPPDADAPATPPPPPAEPPVATPEKAAPAVVAPPRLRHRPQPAEGADVEDTPAMLARRQRRIRRTASSPEVGDRLVRLDGGSERPQVPRSPPPNMTPLRRRMVLAQQTQKPREQMTTSSLHEQFLQVCIKLNESRFREVMIVAARIATVATINQTDGSGRTALSHLCVHGNGRCVEEFSRLPYVDANLADKDGNTPLHHAAQAGHAAVVSALLENYTEIEVDAKNRKGITPLIKACVQGKSKCAKLLLSHGADPLTRDPSRGLTCIEWSYYCGRHACARLVEAYLLARDHNAGGAPCSGGLKRVSSEPELAPPNGGAPGWFRAKFRRLLGRCSPPRQPQTPPRQRRPSLPAAGEEQRDREAPPRPPVRVPEILVEEVEVAVDPVIVRYGDWVAPSQRQRQHNQVVNLCLPGTAEEFLYE